jgi:hypothetical protein
MACVKIVEQDPPGSDWRPWEPPVWLIALGLCGALLIGFARASDVVDPRLAHQPKPTPCALYAEWLGGSSFAWRNCV